MLFAKRRQDKRVTFGRSRAAAADEGAGQVWRRQRAAVGAKPASSVTCVTHLSTSVRFA